MVYDLIIIGAGPAGMTAAIYAARKKLKTLMLTKDIGGQTAMSSDIENYPGFTMITGAELVKKFEEHLEEFKDDVELRLTNNGVGGIKKEEKGFTVSMPGGSEEKAKAIIITGGKIARKLNVEGEQEFLNRGVSYCAWCDGPLFANKEVAIVGGGNSALDAAINLAKLVKQAYIINISSSLEGDPIMIEKVKTLANVRIINNANLKKINGSKFVEAIEITDKESGLDKEIKIAGVFIEIGSVPASDYLIDLIKLNEQGEIIIDEHNMTSEPGIFAAGDITDTIEKQIIVAAGEGAKAAIQASQYLSRR
ncbi:MAG: FAD-dependent oxidoreductase [bacterium]|nr:FAD-dependent oxidoreductase [bacterium]